MAVDKRRAPPTSGLEPAPTVDAPLEVSQVDIDDEADARMHAKFCFAQAKKFAAEPSGPKWMAEGLKAQRLARNIREKISEIENDIKRMEFMRQMKATN